MRQKGFAPIIVLVVVLAVVIVGGGLIYYSKQLQPIKNVKILPSIQPTSNPTNEYPSAKITDGQALAIARQHGFNASDLVVDQGTALNRYIPNPSGPDTVVYIKTIRIRSCSLNKTMDLDPDTGQILDFKDEVWCGGMP